MSEENVALIRGLYEEWSKGTLVPGEEFYAPDALFEPLADGREAFDVAGFHRFMQGFLEQWEGFRMEPQDILDFGDAVIVTERQRATGSRSGIEIDMTSYAVWSFRDGLISGCRWELDLDAAKQAASRPD